MIKGNDDGSRPSRARPGGGRGVPKAAPGQGAPDRQVPCWRPSRDPACRCICLWQYPGNVTRIRSKKKRSMGGGRRAVPPLACMRSVCSGDAARHCMQPAFPVALKMHPALCAKQAPKTPLVCGRGSNAGGHRRGALTAQAEP